MGGRTFFYDHERNDGWNERPFEFEFFSNTKGTKWDELFFTTTKGTKGGTKGFLNTKFFRIRKERSGTNFYLRPRKERRGYEGLLNTFFTTTKGTKGTNVFLNTFFYDYEGNERGTKGFGMIGANGG